MGIRFYCPNGHKLNVKAFLAGKRGICPHCGASVLIPLESTRPSSKSSGQSNLASPGGSSEPVTTLFPDETPRVANHPLGPAPVVSDPFGGAQPQAVHGAASHAAPPLSGSAHPSVDPIAESPDAIWYVRPPSGGQYGPAVGSVMRNWLEEGRVGPEALVWREGWKDWRHAQEVFTQLHAGDPLVVVRQPTTPAPAAVAPPVTRRSRGWALPLIATLAVLLLILIAVLVWILWQRAGGDGQAGAEPASIPAAEAPSPDNSDSPP